MAYYRKIYRLDLTLRSPLAIGSGKDADTDKDVIVDNSGVPFIPASSLTGVLRSYIAGTSGVTVANAVFGYIPDSSEAKEKAKNKDPEFVERECCVRVYDGLYNGKPEDCYITNRDMVALKDKVGVDGAKFDMEAVETGAKFTAYIELLRQSVTYQVNGKDTSFSVDKEIEAAVAALSSDKIRLGSKTSRGYGSVSLSCSAKTFADVKAWLDFDMIEDNVWNPEDEIKLDHNNDCAITLGLRLCGGISIREYTTAPGKNNETMPDYMQLSLHGDKQVPVIPGTSWAGAIRDRFYELSGCDEKARDDLFGFVHEKKRDGDDNVKKSVIYFSESQLSGGKWKTTTRNAIDRFSGATKDGTLYTERTYYGGETTLVISFTKDPDDRQITLLSACLADLHNGFLAVGGLTSVGRGLFEIGSVNGVPVADGDNIFDTLKSALEKMLKKEGSVNE